jgi:hypothetical protein
VAAALLDDAVHDREAEPGAVLARLGREERLEDALEHLAVHAAAVVAHAQLHVVARGQIGQRLGQPLLADGDRDAAAAGHGVARVDHQVQQHLLDLRGIDPRRARPGRRADVEVHVLAERTGQDALGAAHGLAQIHHLRVGSLPAGEGEQPPHQRGGAIGGGADRVQLGRDLRAARQPQGQELGRADDAGEQVVELVGDATRQAADGVHLDRLQLLLFQAAGDAGAIAGGQQEKAASVVIEAAAHDLPGASGAARPHHLRLHARGARVVLQRAQHALHARTIRGRHHVHQVDAGQVAARPQHFLRRVRRIDDSTASIHDDHGIGEIVQNFERT